MKQKRPMQQCVALLRDGSRCGKYAKDGETLCSVHKPDYVPKGAAVPRPKVMTHAERLELFARSSDERVAMQAIGLLERLGAREQQTSPTQENIRGLLVAMTPQELADVRSHVAAIRAIKAQVWSRRPDLRPSWVPAPQDEETTDAPVTQHSESSRSGSEVPIVAGAAPEPIAEHSQGEDSANDTIEVISTAGPRVVRRGDFTVI